MAYFVYRIFPDRRLEFIDRFDDYRSAKVFVRARRQALEPDDDSTVRMVFAPSQEQAERLLMEVREARPLGEDA